MKMADSLAIISVFSLLLLHSATSDLIPSELKQSKSNNEICTAGCLKKVTVEANIIGSADSCARGCRLFTISHLISDTQELDHNSSRSSCKQLCQDSYKADSAELLSCKTGCDLSTVQSVQVPVVAEISWSLFIDNGNTLQILQGEVPETDDVLTDPGLRSQVARLDLPRLPKVSLRTLPLHTDEGGESVKMGPCSGLNNPGLPYSYCLIWSLLLLLLLFVLWSCLSLADLPLQQAPVTPIHEEKLPLA